jgi:hypothetical protein
MKGGGLREPQNQQQLPLPGVASVVLAHPGKTRLIAEAQIKTDRLDAEKLATLLRGNFVAEAHASPPACSDLFGKKGLQWLRTLALPAPDGLLLQQSLAGFDQLTAQIKALEAAILAENQRHPAAARLFPGRGVGGEDEALVDADRPDAPAHGVLPGLVCPALSRSEASLKEPLKVMLADQPKDQLAM